MANKNENFSAQQLIEQIVDESSFVKTYALFKGKTVLGEAFGEGAVTGFATLDGIAIGVFAIDGQTLKGAIGAKNAKKIVSLIDNCIKTSTPLLGIIDSSGARFTEGVEVLEGYADILKAVSAAKEVLPVIMTVSGNCFGSIGYLLPMADVCYALEGATVATSSPLITASKTTMDVNKVCTAEIRYNGGIFDGVFADISDMRQAVAKYLACYDLADDFDDLNRTCNIAKDADVYSAIGEIFDTDSFVEVKKGYTENVVTGFARIGGATVGVIGFKGSKLLCSACVKKIVAFKKLCAKREFPLVNLVDCKGVVNNINEEHGQLIPAISELFDCAGDTNTTVSLVVGEAIGLGYTAFVAKNSGCDYALAFEDAYIGALSGEATAALLYQEEIKTAADPDEATKKLAESYGKENCCAVAVGESGFIDNVIPREFARKYLAAIMEYMG